MSRAPILTICIFLSLTLTACGGGGGGGLTAGGGGSSSSGGGSSSSGGGSSSSGGGSSSSGGGSSSSGGGSSSSGGGSSSSGGGSTPTVSLGANQGQALLGPIVDATVTVYEAENFDGTVICTVMTSSEDASEGPGVIDLSSCLIESTKVYYLIVRGGMDIDADDDGVLDTVPTTKNGDLRAIISGQNILDGDFRINIVTEVAYQGVSDVLLRGGDNTEILERLNSIASQLLLEDLNNDGKIDNSDLLYFSPINHSESISSENSELLENILAAILSGQRNELVNLTRQYLLASYGEFSYTSFLDSTIAYQNFLISDIVVENDYLYAVGYEADSEAFDLKILILDVENFSNANLIGEVTMTGLPADPRGAGLKMAKSGNYLYIISGAIGMIIADVSEPVSPTAEVFDNGVRYEAITVGDNTLYVSQNDFSIEPNVSSLLAFDLSNPSSPILQNTLIGHSVFSMVYEDGYLYTYGKGVGVIDVRTPGSLNLLGNFSFPSSSGRGIAYKNGFVYVPTFIFSDGNQGIDVYNVSTPSNITHAYRLAGAGFVFDLKIDGEILYSVVKDPAEFNRGQLVTSRIEPSGDLTLLDSRSSPLTFQVIKEDDVVYLSSTTNISAYDAKSLTSNPGHLAFKSTPGNANTINVSNGVAFISDGEELTSVDVSNPEVEPVIISSLSINTTILDMAVDLENGAAFTFSYAGMHVVGINDPANMMVLGVNDEILPLDPGGGRDDYVSISVEENLVFVLNGSFPAILAIYDVTDKSNPVLISQTNTSAIDISVSGNFAYAVAPESEKTLNVFNISESTSPFLITPTTPLLAAVIEVFENYVYTTSSTTAGLTVLNISNGANPILYGGLIGLGIGNAISVSGNVAYVANEFGYIETYDISDKTKPEFLGIYESAGAVKDVFATDDYIYAVNGWGVFIEPAVKLQNIVD